MSSFRSRRKSSLKGVSDSKEPPGTILKFQWSISAAHLALLEESSSVTLPSIDGDQSQQKLGAVSSSVGDQRSVSQYSISTHKSLPLLNVNKQCQPTKSTKQFKSPTSTKQYKPPTSTEQKKSPHRGSPLSLSYAQLRRVSPPLPLKGWKQQRLSIFQTSDDKRNSISILSDKISLSSRPSITATPTKSLLPSKANAGCNLVRLQTPQLRRLNVSEKYMNEAKKLYFDANCRSFVPTSTAEVF